MALNDGRCVIIRGPSKFDLMLALCDTDCGVRKVRFVIVDLAETEESAPYKLTVVIDSAKRLNRAATHWFLAGAVAGGGRVVLAYDCRKRNGKIRTTTSPPESGKERALMVIIQKIIARYQDVHRRDEDSEIFALFERAKRVRRARDHEAFVEAIEGL